MSTIKFTLRFYPDQDNDLLDFLDHLRDGDKNQALKATLRRGIQAGEQDVLDPNAIRQIVCEALDETQSALIDAASTSAPNLDRDFVRQVIQETMQDVVAELPGKHANGAVIDAIPFDLADVRQVVEVALQEHADRLGVIVESVKSVESPGESDQNETDEVDALVDSFGQSVLR